MLRCFAGICKRGHNSTTEKLYCQLTTVLKVGRDTGNGISGPPFTEVWKPLGERARTTFGIDIGFSCPIIPDVHTYNVRQCRNTWSRHQPSRMHKLPFRFLQNGNLPIRLFHTRSHAPNVHTNEMLRSFAVIWKCEHDFATQNSSCQLATISKVGRDNVRICKRIISAQISRLCLCSWRQHPNMRSSRPPSRMHRTSTKYFNVRNLQVESSTSMQRTCKSGAICQTALRMVPHALFIAFPTDINATCVQDTGSWLDNHRSWSRCFTAQWNVILWPISPDFWHTKPALNSGRGMSGTFNTLFTLPSMPPDPKTLVLCCHADTAIS